MNNTNSIELTQEQLDLIIGGYTEGDKELCIQLIKNFKALHQPKEVMVGIVCGAAQWTRTKLVDNKTGLTQEEFRVMVDDLWDTVTI
jgi:hypothetical protein